MNNVRDKKRANKSLPFFFRTEFKEFCFKMCPSIRFNDNQMIQIINSTVWPDVLQNMVETNMIVKKTLNSVLKKNGKLLFALFLSRTLFMLKNVL